MTGSGTFAGILAILFSSLVWGTTGTAATFAPEVSAAAIGAAAMGIGGLLQGLLAARGIVASRAALRQERRMLILGGVSVALYPLAFYASMRLAGVTIGTVVTIGAAPLLSALIEYVFDRVRLTRQWLAGAVVGLAGMGLICLARQAGQSGPVSDGNVPLGIALGLVGALTYAIYAWTARRLMLRGLRPAVAMGATFGLGGLLLMPVLVATGAPFLASWTNAGVGLYMAVVPMFLGYTIFGYGLARVSASMATTITLTEPVIAAILAVIVVGERLPDLGWIGIAMVIGSLVIVSAPAGLLRRRAVGAPTTP